MSGSSSNNYFPNQSFGNMQSESSNHNVSPSFDSIESPIKKFSHETISNTPHPVSVNDFGQGSGKEISDKDFISKLRQLTHAIKKFSKKMKAKPARSKLQSAAFRLSMRIEKTETKRDRTFICHLFIHGIKVTTVESLSLKESRVAAHDDALRKFHMPYLRVIRNSSYRELQASSKPFSSKWTPKSSFHDDNAPDCAGMAGKNLEPLQAESANKESNIGCLANRSGIIKSLDKFVILEPKKPLLVTNVISTLQRSALLSEMLLEHEYIFYGDKVKCILRIENNVMAEVTDRTKKTAKLSASIKAIGNLLQICWTIKTKTSSPIREKFSIGQVINPENCGMGPDQELTDEFRQRVKSALDDFMSSPVAEVIVFSSKFRPAAKKIIQKEYTSRGLKGESVRKHNASYHCIWRPQNILFDYLQSVGGVTNQYRLIPPKQNHMKACGSSIAIEEDDHPEDGDSNDRRVNRDDHWEYPPDYPDGSRANLDDRLETRPDNVEEYDQINHNDGHDNTHKWQSNRDEQWQHHQNDGWQTYQDNSWKANSCNDWQPNQSETGHYRPDGGWHPNQNQNEATESWKANQVNAAWQPSSSEEVKNSSKSYAWQANQGESQQLNQSMPPSAYLPQHESSNYPHQPGNSWKSNQFNSHLNSFQPSQGTSNHPYQDEASLYDQNAPFQPHQGSSIQPYQNVATLQGQNTPFQPLQGTSIQTCLNSSVLHDRYAAFQPNQGSLTKPYPNPPFLSDQSAPFPPNKASSVLPYQDLAFRQGQSGPFPPSHGSSMELYEEMDCLPRRSPHAGSQQGSQFLQTSSQTAWSDPSQPQHTASVSNKDGQMELIYRLAASLQDHECTANRDSRLHKAAHAIGLKIKEEEAPFNVRIGYRYSLVLNNIVLASGIPQKKKLKARKSVYLAAIQNILNPNVQFTTDSGDGRLFLVDKEFKDGGNFPTAKKAAKIMVKIAAKKAARKAAKRVTTEYNMAQKWCPNNMQDFVLYEPTTTKDNMELIRLSGEFNDCRVRADISKGGAIKCHILIGNEFIASGQGKTKTVAVLKASRLGVMRLKSVCWHIKIKPTPTDREVLTCATLFGDYSMDTTSNNYMISKKLHEYFESYARSKSSLDLLFLDDFSTHDLKLIKRVGKKFNLVLRSNPTNTGYSLSRRWTPDELVKHLQACGGEDEKYILNAPPNNKLGRLNHKMILRSKVADCGPRRAASKTRSDEPLVMNFDKKDKVDEFKDEPIVMMSDTDKKDKDDVIMSELDDEGTHKQNRNKEEVQHQHFVPNSNAGKKRPVPVQTNSNNNLQQKVSRIDFEYDGEQFIILSEWPEKEKEEKCALGFNSGRQNGSQSRESDLEEGKTSYIAPPPEKKRKICQEGNSK